MNTNAPKGELQPPYGLVVKNFELRAKSLVQIMGADTLNTTRLGNDPVRGLYRYYDQITGAKRLIAVADNLIYTKEDGDTFKVLGYNTGKVAVTNGSKRVTGLWGTNWDYWAGDGDGSNLTLIISGVQYPVSRVTSYDDLYLASNFSGSTSDSIAYILAPTVNDTNFVDFEFWREKLFMADGINPVKSWRHDDGMQWGYWVVDSFFCDTAYSASCGGSTGLTIPVQGDSGNIAIAQGTLYDDSSYCVVFRDTTTAYTFRTPFRIYGVTGGTTVSTFCVAGDTAIIGASWRHIKFHDWVYVVMPRSLSYAFSLDTIQTGYFDRTTTIAGAGLGGLTVQDMYDDDVAFTTTQFSSGVYAVSFGGDDDVAYVRTVTNSLATSDSVKVRVVYDGTVTPSTSTEYCIMRLNYYPKANYVRANNDRLWFSGIYGQPDELWYSELLDPYRILIANTYNPFYLSRGDKPYVTGLASIYDRLFAFKNAAIWGLSGYDEFDFQRRSVYSDFGATSPYSLTKYFNDAYLTSTQGLFQFDGQALTYHSNEVREYFEDSLETALVDNVAVRVFEDQVWIGLATAGTYNNTTLLYNFTGTTELDVYNSSAFTVLDAPGDDGSLIIGADSGVVYQYGTRDSLDYTLPSPVWQSPFVAFGDDTKLKRLDKVELTYSMQSGGKIAVDVFTDFATTAAFTDTIDVIRASHDRAKVEVEAYGYNFSVRFTGVGTRKLEISGWGAEVIDFGEDENYK